VDLRCQNKELVAHVTEALGSRHQAGPNIDFGNENLLEKGVEFSLVVNLEMMDGYEEVVVTAGFLLITENG
jgi:hypothetical protein